MHAADITEKPEDVAKQPASCSGRYGALGIVVEASGEPPARPAEYSLILRLNATVLPLTSTAARMAGPGRTVADRRPILLLG